MGFFDKLRNEFVDIIEWVDNTQDTLVWKFPRYQDEIKMGAKLTVRESQVAVFMNEGVVADVFTPGLYELNTQNMPVMTTLRSWKYGFDSPFKADVYFVSMRQFVNQKWGTKNPVMLRDAEFGPVRLRAFGSFNFRVKDAGLFIKEVSATNPDFTVELINEQLRNTIVSRGMDAIAQAKILVLDLAANYDEVGTLITNGIQPDFTELGLTLTKTLIENISLPPEVEEALDKRSSMGIIGNLGAYAQYQAANSMEKAAENDSGGNLGAAGMGLGLGAAMAGQIGNVFKQNTFDGTNPSGEEAPPALPTVEYHVAIDGKDDGARTLSQIAKLADSGVINKDTLVWKKGMAGWVAAGTVEELKDIFDNEPPPLPLA